MHLATGVALLCVLASCAVGPNFTRPAAPMQTHFSSGDDPTATASAHGTAQRFSSGGQLPSNWWHLFNSSKLDAILAEALANNPGLQATQASLRESQDNLRSGYGIFYPQVTGDAAATRQRNAPARLGLDLPPSIFNLFTLSATVSYALDIFGGERRTLESLHAAVALESATEQAAYVTLTANIVNTVVARAAYRAEIDATRQLIDLERQQVNIAEVQARAGTVPYSNVLGLRGQLASYEANVPQLEQKLTQSNDLLATLAGHPPAEWSAAEVNLADLALPSYLPVSLPSDLVRERPDILAAEATAHAASANIGVATAALLPSITLSGNYAANSTSVSTLFASSGNSWSVGANATAPLLAGGTLWFRRKAAIDNYDQAMSQYRETVLVAFGQVADTLRALDHDAIALHAEDDALEFAAEALRLVQANYQAGLGTYLDVLTADAEYHQAKVNDLQMTAVRYQDTVALFAALGGGWKADL